MEGRVYLQNTDRILNSVVVRRRKREKKRPLGADDGDVPF